MNTQSRPLLFLVSCLLFASTADAATSRNDDSCDIAVLPAATLLVPYFEVDLQENGAANTIFSVTNVGNLDRIARVTLWNDEAAPIVSFNMVLTGYDAQSISLRDVLAEGRIASAPLAKRGKYSDPNAELSLGRCDDLPTSLDDATLARVRQGFGEEVAVGYATIDLVDRCSTVLPTEPAYWKNDIAFDNVLTGDYQQLDTGAVPAQGAPMVHLRAIPEGGTSAARRASPSVYDAGFERTFYSRYLPEEWPKLDARQPLPSAFAVRWEEGASLRVWRERDGDATEVVVFDEEENAFAAADALSWTHATRNTIPSPPNDAASGWIYLNFPGQSWVAGAVDAVALGNGCSPAPRVSEVHAPNTPREIGPAPNRNPSTRGTATTDNDASCDVGLYPAATLLLPYFEVNFLKTDGENTTFTVTNVSPEEQIAHVTLWTDYSVPVISFNIYLTGYDVQSIDLHRLIARGIIGPVEGLGTSVAPVGAYSDRNPGLEKSLCSVLPGIIPQIYVERMQAAFSEGVFPQFGATPPCQNVGNEHDNAVGYVTIDVTSRCSTSIPTEERYWTEEVIYDNVLIGDYEQVHPAAGFAQSAPMVHIRAIPEDDGGAPLDRTFYARYQDPATPALDRRQPLPSLFASRWIAGIGDTQTFFKMWREGTGGLTTDCMNNDDENVSRYVEFVRFDENENAFAGSAPSHTIPTPRDPRLPATSRVHNHDDDVFPQATNGAPAGWMYFNLDNGDGRRGASSNWVLTSMFAGRYAVEFPATALANGCTAAQAVSEAGKGTGTIEPP
jgi:hypothetical protein